MSNLSLKDQETVVEIISNLLGIDESKVTDDSFIKDELGADSLDVVEIAMKFEEEFDIHISDDEIYEMVKVSDYYELIDSKK